MYIFQVNLLGIIFSTLSAFAIGGLWYSVFFGKLWSKVSGNDAAEKRSPGLIYGTIFIFNILAAFSFGWLFRNLNGMFDGLFTGFIVGLAIVALFYSINYLGAGRKIQLLAIDAGFQVVRFSLFGLLFGLFN